MAEDKMKMAYHMRIDPAEDRLKMSGRVHIGPEDAEDIETLLKKVREAIIARINTLDHKAWRMMFKYADDQRDGKLDFKEFENLLNNHDIEVYEDGLKKLFHSLDHNNDGEIDLEELLNQLRGEVPLSGVRLELVRTAFHALDKNNDSAISIHEAMSFNKTLEKMQLHPDVQSGAKSVEQVIQDRWNSLGMDKNSDGTVTLEEFEKYWTKFSDEIDDDKYFELMIKKAYK